MFDGGSTINEKIPYLGDIPVLGKFFQRARETHEEQELIVAVTPRLVTAGSQDQTRRAIIRNDMRRIAPIGPPLLGIERPPAAGPPR